jgi:predicted negative regulator of RcsB-dependent stress response
MPFSLRRREWFRNLPGSMNIPPPAGHQPPEQPVIIEPGFEVTVQAFWDKNRVLITAVCVAALLAIIGREAWQYYAAQQEESVREQYARLADRPEQLSAFAAANANHVLAGLAYLQIADSKYAAADYRQSGENYKKAVAGIKNPILLGRAKLGAAMSLLNGGEQAAAEAALKVLSADPTLPRGARAEAAYHLATLANDAGNSAEVARLVAEMNKVDATGVWTQRATGLLMTPKVSL